MTIQHLRRHAALLGALSLLILPLPLIAQEQPTGDDSEPAERAARAESSSSPLDSARAAYDRGEWDEAVALYTKAASASDATQTLQAEAAVERSSILWEQGRYEEARRLAEDALKIATTQRLDALVGRLMITIGHIETSQGQLAKAQKTFRACALTSKEREDEVFSALCRMNLAMVDRMRGQSKGSPAQFEQDIAALKRAKTPLTTGSALAKTGELFAQSGDLARALTTLEEAQRQFEAAQSIPAQAKNRIRMARVLQSMGEHDRARAQLLQAQAPLSKMKNRPALVDVEGLLGKDAELRGDRAQAATRYDQALKLAKGVNSPQLIARSHLALCELLAKPTPQPGVEPHCDAAASAFKKLNMPELEARARITQATLAHQKHTMPEARRLYTEAIELLDKKVAPGLRDDAAIATQRANLCQVNHALEITGTLLSCRDALDALLALPNSAAYTSHIASTYYILGFAAQREKRIKPALAYFEQAAAAFLKTSPPDPVRSADAHLRMGIIYGAVLKGEQDAITALRKGLATLDSAQGPAAITLQTQLRQQLVQQLITLEQWDEARIEAEALRAFATTHKDHGAIAHACNNLAVAHLRLKDRPAAIAALEAGVQAARRDSNSREQLTLMEENLKKLKN